MKIIRKMVDCWIEVNKFKAYVCESTTRKHKGELEIINKKGHEFEITCYDINSKETKIKTLIAYIKEIK